MIYSAQGRRAQQILHEIAPDLLDECGFIENQASTAVEMRCRTKKTTVFFEDGEESARSQMENFVAIVRKADSEEC